MADHTDDKASKHEAATAKEREQRGIPPEMEESEAKGGPHDDRLQSEVAHGRPEDAGKAAGERG